MDSWSSSMGAECPVRVPATPCGVTTAGHTTSGTDQARASNTVLYSHLRSATLSGTPRALLGCGTLAGRTP